MIARLALVALVVAAGVATWAVVRPADSAPSLEEAADDLVAAGVPAVLVRLRDGAQVDAFGRGAAPADSRFRVGSVTKTFVAALTLILADEGAISLDDTVAQHVPGLLTDGEHITVRDLVAHTAGLFDYTFEPRLRHGELTPEALVAIADGRERTSGYAYSSTNYLALGLVLEAATGERLATLLRRHVFEPFGLRETTFEPGRVTGEYLHGHERSSRDGVATGHLRDTDERTARSAWGAGAIVSTSADLDRFFVRLLRSDLGRRMRPPEDARYGLGLARLATDCGTALGHTGNLLGTITVVGLRGERLLVLAANVFPLTPRQETALRRVLDRALCG